MNTIWRSMVALLLVLGASAAGIGAIVVAAQEAEPTSLELSVSPSRDEKGHEVEGEFWITAVLQTASGRFVGKRRVEIVEPVDLLGPREASLGTAVTDATGIAAVLYHPAQTGEHTIRARFKGDKTYGPTQASLDLEIGKIIPPFESEPIPLASVGKWLSFGLGLLGVAFWAVLLGVLGRTVRGIRAAATDTLPRAKLADQTAEPSRQEVM